MSAIYIKKLRIGPLEMNGGREQLAVILESENIFNNWEEAFKLKSRSAWLPLLVAVFYILPLTNVWNKVAEN